MTGTAPGGALSLAFAVLLAVAPASLRGEGTTLESITAGAHAEAPMALEGMFRYLADAASFTDCRTGRSYPVAMEGGYLELERAYLNSRIDAGAPVRVRLQGRYLERPLMEGEGNVISLIVDSFENLLPDSACAPTDHAELLNTYWKLVEIDGKTVHTPEGHHEAHFVLLPNGGEVRGHGGCNRFFGRIERNGETLSFLALSSTMQACPEGMETEQALLDALRRTDRHEISGLFLTLFEGETPLGRFEAIYF